MARQTFTVAQVVTASAMNTLQDSVWSDDVNAQTGTSYTLVLTDSGKQVTMNNASASTLTVPPNSSVAFAVGVRIKVIQLGVGVVTITAGAGVTLNSLGNTKTMSQYQVSTLLKTATNTWIFDDAVNDLAITLMKQLVPVGTINPYAGATAPTGWILCDGTAVSAGTYPELYAICATTPDLRGNVPLGKTAAGVGSTLLGTGGSTTITTANLPSHTHANTVTNNAVTSGNQSADHTHTVSTGGISANHTHGYGFSFFGYASGGSITAAVNNGGTNATTGTVSSDHSHSGTTSGMSVSHNHSVTSNVTITNAAAGSGTAYNQPFVAVNYIIKHDYV